MSPTADEAGELLRARGLRSTPQRRAILAVFRGDPSEHLSADEVYARASQSLPDLSRGTVYATLAEFTDAGLLASFGAPEPVRYESNTTLHSHFRCRLCLRLFDLTSGFQDPGQVRDRGFAVERIETRAEGICRECNDYDAGLKSGARAVTRSGPPGDTLAAAGAAASEVDAPLGRILLAATAHGLTRVAFEEHADAAALRAHASSRRGSRAARRQLAEATEQLARYFAGSVATPVCEVDWDRLESAGPPALMAAVAIPYATHRSYSDLGVLAPARELGRLMGANPVPIVTPCHRVSRGTEVPATFVAGHARRRWLELHEREHSGQGAAGDLGQAADTRRSPARGTSR